MAEPVAPPFEDQLAIREVFARYAWAYDCRDFEAVGRLFTADGVMVAAGRDRRTGRQEIVSWLRQHVVENHLDKVMQHHVQHLVLDGNADRCRAWSYWMVPARIQGGGCVVGAFGWYEDELVKQADRWYFQRRAFHDGMPDGLPWEG
ncbi:MAG: hypothetical protein RLZZ393_399 [Pseudomonadota bacterium]|jgi:uncharacterized protein (TIGR02246 family)